MYRMTCRIKEIFLKNDSFSDNNDRSLSCNRILYGRIPSFNGSNNEGGKGVSLSIGFSPDNTHLSYACQCKSCPFTVMSRQL